MKTDDSSGSRKRLAFWLLVVATALVPGTSTMPQALSDAAKPRNAPDEGVRWTIKPNGNFNALFGFFAVHAGRLHVYSQLERVLNDKTGKKELVPDSDELEPLWKGEDYYHELYDLIDGVWIQKRREFARDLGDAYTFDRCDSDDRRSLRLTLAMKRELPSPIKIKAVHRAPDYAAVVYTDSSQLSNSVFGTPPIEVDLLVPDKGGWRVAASEEVDEYGAFCRAVFFRTTLADGEPATILLVFTDDSGATNRSFTANSLLLRKYRQ